MRTGPVLLLELLLIQIFTYNRTIDTDINPIPISRKIYNRLVFVFCLITNFNSNTSQRGIYQTRVLPVSLALKYIF